MQLVKRKPIVGVVGASSASLALQKLALEVGKSIAQNGWILVNGGLGGVMEASAQGASEAGGTVVGVVPGPFTKEANRYVTIPVATNMGHARNVILAHTADCLIAVGGEEGTLSEIALGLKLGKLVVGIETWEIPGVVPVKTPKEAIAKIQTHLTIL